jgi:hypothetical protein
MNCPSEIAEILFTILKLGILRARASGWEGNAARCAIELDHAHNLPDLLNRYSPEALLYYWEVERPEFIRQSNPSDWAVFEPLWAELARHIPGSADRVPA